MTRRRRFLDSEEAFAARTQRQGECLIWTGSKDRKGYGVMQVRGKQMFSHRYAWERKHGPIPDGHLIDHRLHCDTACVEADHLRPATPADNARHQRVTGTRSATGLRNVYQRGSRFYVQIHTGGRRLNFGTYDTLEEASAVAREMRLELFGEFAGDIIESAPAGGEPQRKS